MGKKTAKPTAGKRITVKINDQRRLEKADKLFDLGNKANRAQRRYVDAIFMEFFNMTAREMRTEMMEDVCPCPGGEEFSFDPSLSRAANRMWF